MEGGRLMTIYAKCVPPIEGIKVCFITKGDLLPNEGARSIRYQLDVCEAEFVGPDADGNILARIAPSKLVGFAPSLARETVDGLAAYCSVVPHAVYAVVKYGLRTSLDAVPYDYEPTGHVDI